MINRAVCRQEGINSVAISEDLVATLGAEAISYPLVTRYLQEAKFAASNPYVTFSERIREYDDCDQAILLTLDEQPFASISQLVRLAIHLRSTQSLRFQVRHLR
jgi:hypothetical protein